MAEESFWFHRTNDIIKHSIILTVRQRSYHDNIADDIIRIMFTTEKGERLSLALWSEKRYEVRSRNGERERLILHVKDKSSSELLKQSI